MPPVRRTTTSQTASARWGEPWSCEGAGGTGRGAAQACLLLGRLFEPVEHLLPVLLVGVAIRAILVRRGSLEVGLAQGDAGRPLVFVEGDFHHVVVLRRVRLASRRAEVG